MPEPPPRPIRRAPAGGVDAPPGSCLLHASVHTRGGRLVMRASRYPLPVPPENAGVPLRGFR
jgi:hypothetical protein